MPSSYEPTSNNNRTPSIEASFVPTSKKISTTEEPVPIHKSASHVPVKEENDIDPTPIIEPEPEPVSNFDEDSGYETTEDQSPPPLRRSTRVRKQPSQLNMQPS